MLNPITESAALIQSIIELQGMIYNLKTEEPEMADSLTKQTRELIAIRFHNDVDMVVRMSTINWVDYSRWHASKACLIGVTNSMLNQLRFPDFNRKVPVKSIKQDINRIGFIVLAFIITSYAWWKFKGINAWIMQYDENKRLIIYLGVQLFVTCVFAFMIFKGRKTKIIIALASIVISIIALLA